jgi:hypothetical protein
LYNIIKTCWNEKRSRLKKSDFIEDIPDGDVDNCPQSLRSPYQAVEFTRIDKEL